MIKLLNKLLRNVYVQGSFFLTVSSLLINFINYLFHFLAARILKPAGYGNLAAFYSYAIICSVPILVFTVIIVQRIGSHVKNSRQYTRTIVIRFLLILKKILPILFLLFLLTPLLSSYTNLPVEITYLIFPSILLSSVLGFYLAVFQGLKIFLLFSILSLILALSKLLSIFLPLFYLGQLFHVLLFQTTGIAFVLLISAFYTNKFLKLTDTELSKSSRTNLDKIIFNRQFFITLMSMMAIVIISNYDIIYVKRNFEANVAGFYSAWSIFGKITYYLVGPVLQVVLVFFSNRSQSKSQEKVLYFSGALIVLVGIFTYFSYKFIGERFVLILFGNQYQSIYAYLGYASLYGITYSCLNLMNTYFLAKNSLSALILPVALPAYLFLITQVKDSLQNIMHLNIYFSASVFLLYTCSHIYSRIKTNNGR
ncbi:hypothetical protein A2313_04520 [Candidatus Roizmanbacteria bacterium RIFOXYB2_FULL_41_10]|uniref:Polysaccharide biosynthesis protein C-terminal domain-containing protein n=1 Tax=Candidatus Roizmanbacteria bacterium RIFOXYA1_FULL_41_12 TaxID=1802082 RepID=A0A1F7K276_9BACT|nr:MAG: hypothetical protein A2209_05025 [Candidatus Roizmanbacteria bacterium RIFOXYA1_FULL_41_12]OGK66243.1 MAG: hypothetical protein A2262_02345 [Candidatus Roizmanbacteria bacterium RIFOXYA2_FULL_41_8]OGK66918.1 MAG: hypothetical protein A2377_03405 [Candidatus Roizmanbacteria bacterium RIFOXYB1_FULL_41_27]OGK70709.1 MAG: hypothetical protein A2403_01300 [Candidatus Roizmanbacteria bacterium RIFOXYC1_FULL_41_16]OGK71591.1 MAG: hypothetical protein A2313_04520 [Candidatus Roizmanbacteria bac